MFKKINLRTLAILLPIDIVSIFVSFLVAVLLRGNDISLGLKALGDQSNEFRKYFLCPASIVFFAIYGIAFVSFRLYNRLLSHATIEDAISAVSANAVALILSIVYNYVGFPYLSGYKGEDLDRLPTGTVVIAGCFITVITVGVRILPRVVASLKSALKNYGERKTRKPVLLYGAGETGIILAKELQRDENSDRVPVAFVDVDKIKTGNKLCGLYIYDESEIGSLVEKYNHPEIVVAIPSATPSQMKGIVEKLKVFECKISKTPSVNEMISDDNGKTQIKDIEIDDLLGREEAKIDIESISGYLTGATCLVTGGGGSIGSELCRQIMKFNPKKLVILDIYENNAYDLENELKRNLGPNIPVISRIASVRDYKRMTDIFDEIKPDVVFHAAAHKHVPLMEESPGEAVKNNILGTYNTERVASEHNVKTFVLISTDKAVNPTNIMGASKRICEIITQSFSKISNTRFVAVRFGNVLGSNGSVVPLFKKQIAKGGPVTVTHKDITRFFMTIPEASRLVIQAGAMAKGGEIFILDMGEPVKIDDLARNMIKLSGYKPDVDIKIEYTGLRHGEKLYEELLRAEEGATAADRNGFFVAKPFVLEWNDVLTMISEFEAVINGTHAEVAGVLKKYIPTFTSDKTLD